MTRSLPRPPSGRQHVLGRGDQRAVVVEIGGGLRSYQVGGDELLDGYAEDQAASGARGQLLVPWPNRLQDGRYRWAGEQHQVPLTEPDKHNAIHGLARWMSWSTIAQRTEAVELLAVVPPQPGWPFSLEVTVRYELDDEGLSVTTTGRNCGSTPLPYACGQHPYLAAHGLVDDCVVRAPGATVLPTDDRGLPTGRDPVSGALDLRQPRRLGDTKLDLSFTDLERDADGRAWTRLVRPDGHGAALWVDESYPYLELFTGDSLPEVDRRRRGLGVEPMTAPPNALATGIDVVSLDPGATWTARWGLQAVTGDG